MKESQQWAHLIAKWVRDHLLWFDGAPLWFNLSGPIFLVSLLSILALLSGPSIVNGDPLGAFFYQDTFVFGSSFPYAEVLVSLFVVMIVSAIANALYMKRLWKKIERAGSTDSAS